MSSNRKNNKNNKSDKSKSKQINNIDKDNLKDDDYDEADKLLEELDRMERENKDISSKLKKIIQSDKEEMSRTEEMNKSDEDELDYLDDEKFEDYLPEVDVDVNEQVVVKSSKGSEEGQEAKRSPKKKSKKREKKNTLEDNKSSDEKSAKADVKADSNQSDKDISKSATDTGNDEETDIEKISEKLQEMSEKEEVKLDFFANLEGRDDKKQYTGLRKKKPGKPADTSRQSHISGMFTNRRNLLIGAAISVLFIVLMIALAVDAGKDSNSSSSGAFLTDIDTKPMIDAVNGYYQALEKGDTELVRTYLLDGDKVSDKEILNQSEELKLYSELIGSSFLITDCYVQKGLKRNEYIAYMKFQMNIKSIETPAVGIYTYYLIDDSSGTEKKENGKVSETHHYKMYININEKNTDINKYIIKMKKSENVISLFTEVDKELEEACNQDENLRAIVEALRSDDANISDKVEGITKEESEAEKDVTGAANKAEKDADDVSDKAGEDTAETTTKEDTETTTKNTDENTDEEAEE